MVRNLSIAVVMLMVFSALVACEKGGGEGITQAPTATAAPVDSASYEPCGEDRKCPEFFVCTNNLCMPEPGEEGGVCTVDGRCNAGLVCVPETKRCVKGESVGCTISDALKTANIFFVLGGYCGHTLFADPPSEVIPTEEFSEDVNRRNLFCRETAPPTAVMNDQVGMSKKVDLASLTGKIKAYCAEKPFETAIGFIGDGALSKMGRLKFCTVAGLVLDFDPPAEVDKIREECMGQGIPVEGMTQLAMLDIANCFNVEAWVYRNKVARIQGIVAACRDEGKLQASIEGMSQVEMLQVMRCKNMQTRLDQINGVASACN